MNCEYCNENKMKDFDTKESSCSQYIDRNMLISDVNIEYEGITCRVKIKYCPMCGRKLEE